jgi:hypothetical protein
MKPPEQIIREQVEAERLLETALRRMNARVLGLTIGALASGALFLATLIIALRDAGKADQGQHLGLLCQFFPGYSVTVVGAFVGAFWAFATGFVGGNVLSRVYNLVSDFRGGRARTD